MRWLALSLCAMVVAGCAKSDQASATDTVASVAVPAAPAALTLDTFHRHADKVAMANVAQLVNCLHSLFLAHEDRFLATPTFDVFEMYGAHVGGQAVRTVFSAT